MLTYCQTLDYVRQEHSQVNKIIAREAKKDSASMKAISALSMLFLAWDLHCNYVRHVYLHLFRRRSDGLWSLVDIRCCNSSQDHNAFRNLVGLEPSLMLFHSIRVSLAPAGG